MKKFSVVISVLLLSACQNTKPQVSQYEASRIAAANEATVTRARYEETCKSMLSAKFSPISAKEAWKLAVTQRPLKNEFESTVEFNGRAEKFSDTLGEQLRVKSEVPLYVFDVSIPSIFIDYDADKREMKIGEDYYSYIGAGGIIPDENTSPIQVVTTEEKIKSRGSYVGENAFGVAVRVSSTRSESYGFAIAETGFAPNWPKEKVVKVEITPQAASIAKQNLGLLVFGRPVAPFTVTATDYDEATIDSPIEKKENVHAVVLEPICMAIYDRTRHKALKIVE
ncbi:MAG: hypothetical protein GC184_10615 [Rhizobiales bacterium]|nr:hypothetical protein [Hyphomicrobiales bacterium]